MTYETKLTAIDVNGITIYLTEEEDAALTAMGAEVAAGEISSDDAIDTILNARRRP